MNYRDFNALSWFQIVIWHYIFYFVVFCQDVTAGIIFFGTTKGPFFNMLKLKKFIVYALLFMLYEKISLQPVLGIDRKKLG